MSNKPPSKYMAVSIKHKLLI